jgi:Siphovirus Gp157
MSGDPHLDFEVHRYKAIRNALLKDNADDMDEQTLADTTEGLTDLHELLAAIVRAALDDETMAGMLKVRMQQMADRLDRIEHRAERRRQIVRDAMLEAGVDKLAMPDFTATVRKAQPHVVVVDENLIPQVFWEMRPHLRKRELGEALKDGAQIEGAALSNPGMTLTVRTR